MPFFDSFLTRAMSKRLPSDSVKLPNRLEKGDAFQVGGRDWCRKPRDGEAYRVRLAAWSMRTPHRLELCLSLVNDWLSIIPQCVISHSASGYE